MPITLPNLGASPSDPQTYQQVTPTEMDALIAQAKAKYPELAQNPKFETIIKEAYEPNVIRIDEHQAIYGPSLASQMSSQVPGYTPEDHLALLYDKTVNNPNITIDDGKPITDADFWDSIRARNAMGINDIYLSKLNSHDYHLNGNDPRGVSTTQSEQGSPWTNWGRTATINGVSMALTIAGLGYASAAGAGASAGASATAPAATSGGGSVMGGGTTGMTGVGTAASSTPYLNSLNFVPSAFQTAGTTYGGVVAGMGAGGVAAGGAGGGGVSDALTLENAGKAVTAEQAAQQGLGQLGGSSGGDSGEYYTTPQGSPGTTNEAATRTSGVEQIMTPDQQNSYWEAVKGGAGKVTDWISQNPMLASQLAQAGINAYTGYKAQQAMQNLPNWEEAKLPAGYYEDPFVQQNLGQINRQVSSAAAARGMNMSGRTLQEIADNSYSKAILPFMQMQYGQNATKNQFNYNKGLAEQGATAGYWSGIGQNASDVAGSWSLQNMMNQQNAQNQQYNQKLDAILGKL